MAIAIDTSVLVDVLLPDPRFVKESETALKKSSRSGLIICEAVIAELVPVAKSSAAMEAFLAEWEITFVASSLSSATIAGEMYRQYLQRGGKRGRVVPDFLIGAHAQNHADALLARDYGFFRDYFKGLTVIDPSPPSL